MITTQSVSEKLLQTAIERSVSEKLGGLNREFSDLTKGLSDEEKKTAAIMILGMLETATSEFFAKMRFRIELKKV